jgi:TPP-dependent pyruvate/acetoin dehydrogenase alpha subunit
MGDPERYRKREEVQCWEDENDPIGIYYRHLLSKKTATEAELAEIHQRAEAEIEAAIQFAEASPEPGPEELFEHIYIE